MRLLAKRVLITGLMLGALLFLPETADSQAPLQLVRVDNSGCPTSTAAAFRAALPDSVRLQAGSALDGSPDILFLATVQADQIRFATKPDIRVRLCGGGDSLRVIERTNLPSPVVPGTTYRNIFINLEILGRMNASCLASKITAVATDTNAAARASCTGLNVGTQR